MPNCNKLWPVTTSCNQFQLGFCKITFFYNQLQLQLVQSWSKDWTWPNFRPLCWRERWKDFRQRSQSSWIGLSMLCLYWSVQTFLEYWIYFTVDVLHACNELWHTCKMLTKYNTIGRQGIRAMQWVYVQTFATLTVTVAWGYLHEWDNTRAGLY